MEPGGGETPIITMLKHLVRVLACVATSGVVLAQTPKFEVASVKPNTSGDGRVSIGIQPGGRFTAVNVPLRFLIRDAYQIQDFQLVGGPSWIDSEHFDVVAKAETDIAPRPPGSGAGPFQLMMRSLLEERFKLATHSETREMPIYELVMARPDRRLGPKLQASSVDCEAMRGRGRGGPPPEPPPPSERPLCGIRFSPASLAGGGMPMAQFARVLSQAVQRVVVDRTGLTGNFDFDLAWTPDQMARGADATGASIFTAVQEQLGLKLEATRGPVDVLVIDRVEHPTPD